MMSKSKSFKEYLGRQSKLEGKRLTDTDFVVKCRNQWKSLSDNEKLLLTNTSNASNLSPNLAEEMTNGSNSFESQILSEEIENQMIDALVKYKSKEELKKTKFFFISTNIQCKVKEEYRPLEIGIIEYIISDGIRLNYHQFIDCGEVPYGYAFEAMDYMQRTHKIPLKNFVKSSDNYLLIGTRILEILSDSCVDQQINHSFGEPMIVFSHTEQIDQNKGVVEWIGKKCNEMRRRDGHKAYKFNIHVLPATKLLSSLLTAAGDCHSMVWCENMITSPAFDYTVGTDCSYHEGIQCIDCAIGVPKRIAYLMSHFLRESYEIRLSAKHLPTIHGFENHGIEDKIQIIKEKPFRFKPTEAELKKDSAEGEKTEGQTEGQHSSEDNTTLKVEKNVKQVANQGVVRDNDLDEPKAQQLPPKSPTFPLFSGVGRGRHTNK